VGFTQYLLNITQITPTPRICCRWKKEAWGECEARACGQEGIQRRSVLCVTAIEVASGGRWRSESVDPRYCLHQLSQPATSRPCQGHPCWPEWTVGQWSEVRGAYFKNTYFILEWVWNGKMLHQPSPVVLCCIMLSMATYY
jgi:hypothetical protein